MGFHTPMQRQKPLDDTQLQDICLLSLGLSSDMSRHLIFQKKFIFQYPLDSYYPRYHFLVCLTMVKVYIHSYFHIHTQSFHICTVRNALGSRATREFFTPVLSPKAQVTELSVSHDSASFHLREIHTTEVYLQMRAEVGFLLGRCRAQLGAIFLWIQGGGRWQDFQEEERESVQLHKLRSWWKQASADTHPNHFSYYVAVSQMDKDENAVQPALPCEICPNFTRMK